MKQFDRRKFLGSLAISAGGFFVAPLIGLGNFRNVTETLKQSDMMDEKPAPSYLSLHKTGELKKRAKELKSMMQQCSLCPRMCGVNRLKGDKGFCGSTSTLKIASYHPHFGEEKPLVGNSGSGTIFLSNCSLLCVFCINWEISHGGEGRDYSSNQMASMMITLQKMGCHNINVVTPTHYSPFIVEALDVAAKQGLNVPLVWNTCGWERIEVLKLLDGIVDIYMPDFKYFGNEMAEKYSAGARSYPSDTQNALLEMQNQVGVAIPGDDGLLRKGLLIRHLVMPNNVGGSIDVMRWIAEHLPKNTYVNIMSQYRPMHKAFDYPEISRGITRKEYMEVVNSAKGFGLTNVDIQGV